MFDKIKKVGIIITIAILFALLANSLFDMVYPMPEYTDYCNDDPLARLPKENFNCSQFKGPSQQEIIDCASTKGSIQYIYDEYGCIKSYECSTCQYEFEQAMKDYRLMGFIATSIIGLIAILSGIYTRTKDEIKEWLLSGFLIGGIISIFIGTISYYSDMGRFIKPIVLLVEIALIIWIVIRTSTKKK